MNPESAIIILLMGFVAGLVIGVRLSNPPDQFIGRK